MLNSIEGLSFMVQDEAACACPMAGSASVTEAGALCGVSPLHIPPLVCKTQLRSPAHYNAAHLCQDCQEIAAFPPRMSWLAA